MVSSSGTVFASTIVLSTGKSVSDIIIIAEILLMISVILGIIIMANELRSRRWIYNFNNKNKLKGDLLKKDMPDFLFKATQDLIDIFDNMLNEKTYLHYVFQVIHPRYLEVMFYMALVLGLLFLTISSAI